MNMYLLIVCGDVEPELHGPYDSEEKRDAFAREWRKKEGDKDGIFPLNISGDYVNPEVFSYSGNFFKTDWVYKVKDLHTDEIHDWTLTEVLTEINRDHGPEWEDYNEEDWREGWDSWVEGDGYYKLVEVI